MAGSIYARKCRSPKWKALGWKRIGKGTKKK